MLKSIVFIPDADSHRWMMACAQYCAVRHYEIVAVVHAWADAIRMIQDGRATVLVTGRPDHLPPDRMPRVEFVADDNKPTVVSSAHRRPIRRPRGARPPSAPKRSR